MLIMSIFNKAILYIAPIVRLHHLTLVVLLAFFFLILICMNFSLTISKLSENHKTLTQEYALLAQRVEKLEEELDDKLSSRMGA